MKFWDEELRKKHTMLDTTNRNKVMALEDLLNGEQAIGWQHMNEVLTDYEFIEAIRRVIGEPCPPEAGMVDINTGLKY